MSSIVHLKSPFHTPIAVVSATNTGYEIRNSLEEGLIPERVKVLLLPLGLLLGRGTGVRDHPQLHVWVGQPVGVHGGKVACLNDWLSE